MPILTPTPAPAPAPIMPPTRTPPIPYRPPPFQGNRSSDPGIPINIKLSLLTPTNLLLQHPNPTNATIPLTTTTARRFLFRRAIPALPASLEILGPGRIGVFRRVAEGILVVVAAAAFGTLL